MGRQGVPLVAGPRGHPHGKDTALPNHFVGLAGFEDVEAGLVDIEDMVAEELFEQVRRRAVFGHRVRVDLIADLFNLSLRKLYMSNSSSGIWRGLKRVGQSSMTGGFAKPHAVARGVASGPGMAASRARPHQSARKKTFKPAPGRGTAVEASRYSGLRALTFQELDSMTMPSEVSYLLSPALSAAAISS